jgi:hypothetical protein
MHDYEHRGAVICRCGVRVDEMKLPVQGRGEEGRDLC